MIEWLRRFLGAPTSSATAKERLRLVLMTDHLALAPDMIDNMKRDLIDVISRYVEVDRDKVEVTFEQEDRVLAMLANIPIVSVTRPTPPPPPPQEPPTGPPPKRRRRKKPAAAKAPATAH
jgi:cell division topological specificity factor